MEIDEPPVRPLEPFDRDVDVAACGVAVPGSVIPALAAQHRPFTLTMQLLEAPR